MKAVVAAFNKEKALVGAREIMIIISLVGAFSVITNLWIAFVEALNSTHTSTTNITTTLTLDIKL